MNKVFKSFAKTYKSYETPHNYDVTNTNLLLICMHAYRISTISYKRFAGHYITGDQLIQYYARFDRMQLFVIHNVEQRRIDANNSAQVAHALVVILAHCNFLVCLSDGDVAMATTLMVTS